MGRLSMGGMPRAVCFGKHRDFTGHNNPKQTAHAAVCRDGLGWSESTGKCFPEKATSTWRARSPCSIRTRLAAPAQARAEPDTDASMTRMLVADAAPSRKVLRGSANMTRVRSNELRAAAPTHTPSHTSRAAGTATAVAGGALHDRRL